MSGNNIQNQGYQICRVCMGTGKAYRRAVNPAVDEDGYPLYSRIKCPMCGGSGFMDTSELYIVPKSMVKDEYFVHPEFTEDHQAWLRKVVEREEQFLGKSKQFAGE